LADSERYTELNEAAQRQQEAENFRCLREVQARLQPESHPDFDGMHCVEPRCAVVLPKARLEMGRIRCVSCQEALERSMKRRT
jgi:hypothetical protein